MYDNDLMAVSGLGEAQRIGVNVPADLSIVAWDDSPTCEFVHPPLTALTRDIATSGAHAARLLAQLADGTPVGHVEEAPLTVLRPFRGSTEYGTTRCPPAPAAQVRDVSWSRTNATAAI